MTAPTCALCGAPIPDPTDRAYVNGQVFCHGGWDVSLTCYMRRCWDEAYFGVTYFDGLIDTSATSGGVKAAYDLPRQSTGNAPVAAPPLGT